MRLFARSAFFLSGAAGLIFEIVWLRHLGLAVGATTLAVATTTAAYMGGLALGSHLGGRIADRLRRPLAAYGLLEIAVALIGVGIPLAARFIPAVDETLLAGLESGAARSLVRFFVALAILIVPTTAMGMTLPVLSRAVVDRLGNVGREVGALYAINIAGAVAGAAAAGFVLIPAAGLYVTNLAAVGLDLALGAAAIAGGLLLRPVASAAVAASAPAAVLRPGGRLLVSLLLVTGAAAMALQVLWTRALGTALGPSTYAFSAIVCAYLVGLALGGAVAARLADRVKSTRLALAIALLATALASLVGILVIDDLPLILHPVVLDPSLTMGGLVRTEFVLAAISVLPATAGMGALFPLTIAAVVGSEARIGAAVGRAYALNTMGNIAGSFAGVFVLLPLVGVEWGMRLAALAYVAAAVVLIVGLERPAQRRTRPLLSAAAALTAAALLFWPSWDVARWTVGLFRLSMARSFFPDSGEIRTSRVVFHADGLASTVTVEEESGTRWIKVNGKIDGSSEGDMPTQVLSGILPMLVHPAPREVAVIGCGTCVTAGAALRAGPERVTLIELEGEVLRAARLFADVNHAPWNDPRFTAIEDDGRNYMMRPGPRFDVIVSEPSNPWMTGAASLFTLEFFEIAARRLAEGGMFLQWLQAYELAPERIGSVLKTFNAVFPHVVVFSAHPDSNDLLLLGSESPISLDRGRLVERFAELRPELARAEIHEVEELLALVLLTDQELRELPESIAVNTDDNALIEFGAPRDLVAFAEDDPELPVIAQHTGKRAAMVARLGGLDARPASMLALAWGYLHEGMLADAGAAASAVAAEGNALADTAREVAELAGFLDEVEDREQVGDLEARAPSTAYARAVEHLAAGALDEAVASFEQPPGRPPQNGTERVLYAYLLYKQERYEAARRHLLAAERDPGIRSLQPAVAYYLARSSYYDGAYARAVSEMQKYRKLKAGHLSVSRRAD